MRAHLCFLHHRGCAWLKISQVTEDALFKLLDIADRASCHLKSKKKGTDDICASDMEDAVPINAGDVVAGGELETLHSWLAKLVRWYLQHFLVNEGRSTVKEDLKVVQFLRMGMGLGAGGGGNHSWRVGCLRASLLLGGGHRQQIRGRGKGGVGLYAARKLTGRAKEGEDRHRALSSARGGDVMIVDES